MKAQIIQIGNSQGIRIPKMMLEDTGISGEVELVVTNEGILIRNIRKPRGDWENKLKALSDADDDVGVETSIDPSFDTKEWHW